MSLNLPELVADLRARVERLEMHRSLDGRSALARHRLVILRMLVNARPAGQGKGVSVLQVARALNIRQGAAWQWIRSCLRRGDLVRTETRGVYLLVEVAS